MVRYTAENLRGCLVETMARFPPKPAPDALLAAVEFVDADVDPELPTVHAVADWLAERGIGRVTAVTPQPLLVDIEAADLLVDLDIHPPIEPGLVVSDDAIADCAVRPANAEWARFVSLQFATDRPCAIRLGTSLHLCIMMQ